jgi:hypothetical protein
MALQAAKFKDRSIELQEINYLCMISIEILSIEYLIVFQVYFYLLIHLSKLDLYIKFSFFDKSLHLENFAFSLNDSSVKHFSLSSRSAILTNIHPS